MTKMLTPPGTGTFLSAAEVTELTQRRNHTTQIRTLIKMGVAHRVRPDGSVAILRAHINSLFHADTTSTAAADKRDKPRKSKQANWNAI